MTAIQVYRGNSKEHLLKSTLNKVVEKPNLSTISITEKLFFLIIDIP